MVTTAYTAKVKPTKYLTNHITCENYTYRSYVFGEKGNIKYVVTCEYYIHMSQLGREGVDKF